MIMITEAWCEDDDDYRSCFGVAGGLLLFQ